MATCARCGGHLTDHHACHAWITATAAWGADLLLGGALGAAAGALVLGQLLSRLTKDPFELVGVGTGMVCGVAIARALRKI